MSTLSKSQTFDNVTNTSLTVVGNNDKLTFIGSSDSGVMAAGQNQTVSLINDSWIVVENETKNALKVLIQGADANITIVDMVGNLNIVLKRQGSYTISDNTKGPMSGSFVTTAHSSLFVMGVSAANLARHLTSVS